MANKVKLIFIFGPTASGKSKLAAKLFFSAPNTSILVSVDSRKVYKHLDIGTNKISILNFAKKYNLTNEQLLGINLLNLDKSIDVSKFYNILCNQIRDIKIKTNYNQIIFFGGSGLYFKTLFFGLNKTSPPVKDLRKRLNKYPTKTLQALANTVLPKAYKKLNFSDKHNPIRLIRLLERNIADINLKLLPKQFKELTPIIKKEQQKLSTHISRLLPPISQCLEKFDIQTTQTFYLPILQKDILQKRIYSRILLMLNIGWLDETLYLLKKYNICTTPSTLTKYPGFKVMGYDILSNYILQKKCKKIEFKQVPKDLITQIVKQHKKLAKVQFNWVNRFKKKYPDFKEYSLEGEVYTL